MSLDESSRRDPAAGGLGEVLCRARRERLHVRGRTRREQDSDQARGGADLRRQGHQREHHEPRRQAQAQPPYREPGAVARTRSGPWSRWPRATRSRSSGADDGHSQAQTNSRRPAVPIGLGLRRDHEGPARTVTRQAQAAHGWTQRLRTDDLTPPGWRTQASVSRHRFPPQQGRRAGQGRRRSSTTRTATRGSRSFITATARSATSWRPRVSVSATCSRVGRARRSARGMRCRCGTSPSAPWCTTWS